MRKLSAVIYHQDPVILPETATVQEACIRMRDARAGSVLVTDAHGALAGIFTGRDAVARVLAEGHNAARTHLSSVMTRNPVTLGPDHQTIDALRLMWDGGFRHVPLVDGNRIIGCISRSDVQGEELGQHEAEREMWEGMR